MPKHKRYEDGDIAKFLPKPQESVSESGKKLQSLFSEFYENKHEPFLKNKNTQGAKFGSNQNEAKSPAKGKKRKFSFNENLKELQSNISDVMKKLDAKLDKSKEPKNKKMKKNSEEFSKNQKSEIKSQNSNCQIQVESEKPAEIKPKRKRKKHKKNRQSPILNCTNQVESQKPEDIESKNKEMKKNSEGLSKKQKKKRKSHTSNSQIQVESKKPGDTDLRNKETKNNLLPQIDFPRKMKKKRKSNVHNNQTVGIENSEIFQSSAAELNVKNQAEVKKPKKFKWMKKDSSSNIEKQKSFDNEQDKLQLPNINMERDCAEESTRTLFVGNLPTNLEKKDLKELFSQYGQVETVRYTPIETNRNKIFKFGGPKQKVFRKAATSLHGFVVFEDRENANNALTLNGTLFKDRHITVNFALPSGQKKIYDNNRTVFIGNLPFVVDDEDVWNAFSGCGKIAGVRIIRDLETGVGKGFGYVLFDTVQAKQKALEMENVEIKGRHIRIKSLDKTSSKGRGPFEKKRNQNKNFKQDSFKSRAIKQKKSYQERNVKSRKSLGKIMKKNKRIHQKKKIAFVLAKDMKL